jgi:hypothetical protein
MNPSTGSYFVTIAVAMISSGGLWGLLQWFLGRRQRANQQHREDVHEGELLAKARAVAQRTALDSASERYERLDDDYEKCRQGLANLSEATYAMIDAVEKIMVRLRPNGDNETYITKLSLTEIGEVRRSINEARRHLR